MCDGVYNSVGASSLTSNHTQSIIRTTHVRDRHTGIITATDSRRRSRCAESGFFLFTACRSFLTATATTTTTGGGGGGGAGLSFLTATATTTTTGGGGGAGLSFLTATGIGFVFFKCYVRRTFFATAAFAAAAFVTVDRLLFDITTTGVVVVVIVVLVVIRYTHAHVSTHQHTRSGHVRMYLTVIHVAFFKCFGMRRLT